MASCATVKWAQNNWSVPIFLGLSDRPKKKSALVRPPLPPPKAGFPAAVRERSPRSSPELSEHLLSLFETVTGSRIKTNVPWFYGMHWACRIRPLQIHDNFRNRLAIPNKHLIFSLSLKEAFCSNSLNISNCPCKHRWPRRCLWFTYVTVLRHVFSDFLRECIKMVRKSL